MIISRTPYRISFFGGGTDYPAWYRQHGGAVLSTTINKYCYITCRYLPPFFEHRFRVVYSKTEEVKSIGEISHPAVREIIRYLGIERGLEIHHDGDLPARSGLGSSSAFSVGLLHALYALKGQMVAKEVLAKEAIYVEQERLEEAVGSQDQVSAAYGGFNHIEFRPSGEFSARRMTLPAERVNELNNHLMLFFTGIKRISSEIAKSYYENVEDNGQNFRLLADMVHEAIAILRDGQDISRFGRLLHEGWRAKRGLSDKVTNSQVDGIYAQAMAAGAVGGKLIGAGGGGFMLLFVHPADQTKVSQALKHLVRVPFRFDSSGSQVIFFDEEEDYSAYERETNEQRREALGQKITTSRKIFKAAVKKDK